MVIIKIRYSIEPSDRIYVKGYGFLSFAKNIGTHATKVAANLTNRCSQKLLDTATHATIVAKKSTTDAIKHASKRAIQKTAETTSDLIGNKVVDKITSVSKSSQNNLDKGKSNIEKPRDNKLLMN